MFIICYNKWWIWCFKMAGGLDSGLSWRWSVSGFQWYFNIAQTPIYRIIYNPPHTLLATTKWVIKSKHRMKLQMPSPSLLKGPIFLLPPLSFWIISQEWLWLLIFQEWTGWPEDTNDELSLLQISLPTVHTLTVTQVGLCHNIQYFLDISELDRFYQMEWISN